MEAYFAKLRLQNGGVGDAKLDLGFNSAHGREYTTITR
jgi:hypothetical protein